MKYLISARLLSISFVKNDYEQMSFNNPYFSLTEREQKMLDRSLSTQFANHIFPLIDEEEFSVLYSDMASRQNTSVNMLVGALILKELRKLTNDEIFESLLFDVRYQRALYTTNFKEQPMSDTSLKRFRNCCLTYEMEQGVDLIRECITELSSEMAKLMKISVRCTPSCLRLSPKSAIGSKPFRQYSDGDMNSIGCLSEERYG